MKKEKDIIFNESVDDSIFGFALVLTFLSIGIFLMLGNTLFAEFDLIIRIAFIIIGIVGFFTEIDKLNKKYNIIGTDNIFKGLTLLTGLYLIYVYLKYSLLIFLFKLLYVIFFLLFLLIGISWIYQGLIQVLYSIYINKKNKKNNKKNTVSSIVVVISQILGIVLVILQITEAMAQIAA
ncbi:MAG: hypothetical protein E7159_01490 [Firmicutes bacterium]|nr:hypothetical protein [Bacillota bacterium]